MSSSATVPEWKSPSSWPIRGWVLVLLGGLYFSQGLPFGFFTQSLTVMLRAEGASLTSLGLLSLLPLPWALKFLWAPAVDRWGSETIGRRRSWILPLQAATIVLLGVMALLPPTEGWRLVLALVVLANLLAATQDIATDGLAVDTLRDSERGWANGLQVAAYRGGMVVGGGALLMAYPYLGWGGVLASMAALLAVASIPIVFHREARADRTPSLQNEHPEADFRGFFRQSGAPAALALVFVFKFGDHVATSMLRPWLVDQSYSIGDIGLLLGTLGFGAAMAGALLGGALVMRLGATRGLAVFGSVQAVSLLSYAAAAVWTPSQATLAGMIVFEHLGSSMATAALFTWMMGWCRPERAATDYTLQASTVVLASGLAAALGGVVAEQWGYGAAFGVGAALAFGAAIAAAVAGRQAPR